MSDWTRVHAFQKHSYVEKFPINSFLVSGVSYYPNTVKTVNIYDELNMSFESNNYDTSAIVITKNGDICGYVPKELKEKYKSYVPTRVKVIDKRYIKENIYSLRVSII
jgi:hypothetical protein